MIYHTAFDTAHPAVPTLYFVGTAVLMMFAVHPVYVGISLVAALAFSACCRGIRRTLAGLRWQLPLLALVCLANPLFSASGSTLLGYLGPMAIYVEALAFGACMGALMVSVLLWLECASRVITQDKMLAVGGRALPTVSLMVSMVAQLVPQLIRRGRMVSATASVCTAARGGNAALGSNGDVDNGSSRRRARLYRHTRLSTVLMSWALEDSIDRSDAMRARGWGAMPHRTTYRTYRFKASDAIAIVGVAFLLALDTFLAWVACSQFHFYPTMPHLVLWWGYVPHMVLMALPTVLDLHERMMWR